MTNIANSTFIEYISKINTRDIFRFIETYNYVDFLNININNISIKCIKLGVKLFDTSNEGHNIKYIFIYKIYV
jgi:hypothetical protein